MKINNSSQFILEKVQNTIWALQIFFKKFRIIKLRKKTKWYPIIVDPQTPLESDILLCMFP